jgi:putative phosphoesterase
VADRAPAGQRLALFGDVHANVDALQAVLAAVDAAGIDAGVCTGDLVMRGTAPAQCIAEVRRRGWPCTLGNTDHKVGTRPQRAPDDPKAQRPGSRSWTSARLSADERAWLAGLPMVSWLRLGEVRVAVMHGSPDDPRAALDGEATDAELQALAARVDADVVVMGHVHRQMARRAGDALFVNPGSVGEAVDESDREPRWAWIEVGPAGVGVHLERVAEPLATVRRP